MTKYIIIISEAILFFVLFALDIALYYGYGPRHSKVPFYVCVVVTVIVDIIAAMAVYQTFRHRKDKEEW